MMIFTSGAERFALAMWVAMLCVPLSAVAQKQQRPATGGANSSYRVPPMMGDGWRTASVDSVGMDRAAVEAMSAAIRRYPDWNLHALLIERDGKLVYEEYFAGEDQQWGRNLGRVEFTRDTKHDLRSVTKSVTSALVGISLQQGKIRSLDQPLLDFFPEYAEGDSKQLRRITLRHALAMTAGIEWNEEIPYTDPRNDEIGMTRSADPIGYVLKRPITSEPGSAWGYNGGLTQVLAAVVQRANGEPLARYAQRVLFKPLGITETEWVGNLGGMPSAASGLRMRARDLAKFGSLYLHDGRWNGQQILPKGWAAESMRRHILLDRPVDSYGVHGYGYQWWQACYQAGAGAFEAGVAVGNGLQRIFVIPEMRLVVTMFAGRYNDGTARLLPSRLLLEHIVPASRWAPRANSNCEIPQRERQRPAAQNVAVVDHLILGAVDLDQATAEVEKRTGAKPVYGGKHPGRGTHNALLSLGEQTYLEVLAPQPDSKLGEDMTDLQKLTGVRPVGWAVLVLDEAEARKQLGAAGFELTESVPGSRVTPSGGELRWVTFGVKNGFAGAPFFIQWSSETKHPATTSPKGCSLAGVRISTPEAKKLGDLVRALRLDVAVEQAAEPSMAVELKCPAGVVRFPAGK